MEVKLTEESSMLKKDLTTSQQKVQTQDSLIAKQRKELAKKDVKLIEYQIAMKELENTHRSEIEQRDKEIESLKKLVSDLQAGKEEGSEQSSSEHGIIENFELRRQLEEKQREIMELKTSFQQLEKEREGEFNSKVREMAEEMEKRKMDISKMRAEIEERNTIIRIMQDSFERQQKERQRDVHKRESEMEGLILSFTNAKHQFESSLKKKDEIISVLKNQLGHKDEESPLLEAKDAQVPSKGTPEDGGGGSGEEKVNKLMEQKEALQFLTNKLQNEVVELKVKAKKGEKEIKSLKEKLSKLSGIQHNNNNNRNNNINNNESQGQQQQHQHGHNFNDSNNNNNNVIPESGGDTEELEQQLFFALAVGIKLNLSMQGKQCTMTTPELYEKAKGANVPRKAWNKWILNTLQGQAAAANNPSFSSWAFWLFVVVVVESTFWFDVCLL